MVYADLFPEGAVKGHVQLLCFKPDHVDEQAEPSKGQCGSCLMIWLIVAFLKII